MPFIYSVKMLSSFYEDDEKHDIDKKISDIIASHMRSSRDQRLLEDQDCEGTAQFISFWCIIFNQAHHQIFKRALLS